MKHLIDVRLLFERVATRIASLFCVATTSRVKSPKCTASTTNACASTATQTCGSTTPTYSTTCLWRRWSSLASFVSMAVCRPRSTRWITSVRSTVSRKCRMRDQCATCFGQILTTVPAGASLLAVLATLLVRTSVRRSTIPTIWLSSLALISLLWRYVTHQSFFLVDLNGFSAFLFAIKTSDCFR